MKLQAFNRLNFKGEMSNRKLNNRKTDSKIWKRSFNYLDYIG